MGMLASEPHVDLLASRHDLDSPAEGRRAARPGLARGVDRQVLRRPNTNPCLSRSSGGHFAHAVPLDVT